MADRILYGLFNDGLVFLPETELDRLTTGQVAAGIDPATVSLDVMGEDLEDFGEERQGLGGTPYLFVDPAEEELVVDHLKALGYRVIRDDDAYGRIPW